MKMRCRWSVTRSGLVVESITLGKVIEKKVTWVNTMFSATMINAQLFHLAVDEIARNEQDGNCRNRDNARVDDAARPEDQPRK